MPKSRKRKGRKPYRPRDIPIVEDKHDDDKLNENRKAGLVLYGGRYGDDLSHEMVKGHRPKSEDDIKRLNRKSRRFGLKKGLLIYENGELKSTNPKWE